MTVIWPLIALLYLSHNVEVKDSSIEWLRYIVSSRKGTHFGTPRPDLDYNRNVRWSCPHHSYHGDRHDLESGQVSQGKINQNPRLFSFSLKSELKGFERYSPEENFGFQEDRNQRQQPAGIFPMTRSQKYLIMSYEESKSS